MLTKTDIRQAIKRRKAACSAEERTALSQLVVARLQQTAVWKAAHTVLLYHPLPDEADTRPLIAAAYATSKRVLLPVVVGDDLELREYLPTTTMAEGAFHIQEPVGAAFTDYGAIDLAVIPGVAFTARGQRLGRGRGYYDRLLSRLTNTYKIGLCWPFQLVEELPTEAHDIPMDAVVS